MDLSVRAAILQCLVASCGDHVGTVRTAAQKALGEAIFTDGLLIDCEEDDQFNFEQENVGITETLDAASRSQRAALTRKIFVLDGTNAVTERQVQAQQVRSVEKK